MVAKIPLLGRGRDSRCEGWVWILGFSTGWFNASGRSKAAAPEKKRRRWYEECATTGRWDTETNIIEDGRLVGGSATQKKQHDDEYVHCEATNPYTPRHSAMQQ